jgi:hypothetical protein
MNIHSKSRRVGITRNLASYDGAIQSNNVISENYDSIPSQGTRPVIDSISRVQTASTNMRLYKHKMNAIS